jgi:hypothetical protein
LPTRRKQNATEYHGLHRFGFIKSVKICGIRGVFMTDDAQPFMSPCIKKEFKEKHIHRVFAHCNPVNLASWKLLERVGLRREGLLRKNVFFRRGPNGEELWTDTYEYAILKEEVDKRLREGKA